MDTCRSCGREIIWTLTSTGKRLPVDAAGHPQGDLQIDGIRARSISPAEQIVLARMPGVVLHRAHRSTCPNGATGRVGGFVVPAGTLTEPNPPPPVAPQVDQSPAPPSARRLIDVWCDGSCPVPMGPGGWAAVMRFIDVETRQVLSEKEIAGYELEATNQRMELQAAAEALYAVTRPARFQITSDSAYLIDGMNKRWYDRWRRNGWRNSQGKPVLNRDLWEVLITAAEIHQVTWVWVKGHAKGAHPLNERADELAGEQTALARQAVIDATIAPDLEDLDAGWDRALDEVIA